MQFHFPFTAIEIIWTLTLAAQLVLLVVLIGRDRLSRFPWFTASIVVLALRLVTGRVLSGRLPRITFGAVMIVLADLSILIGLMVLVELARRSFRGARRSIVIGVTVLVLAIGGAVLAWWAPWPSWKSLTASPNLTALLLMQLVAQKGEILLDLLAVEFGVIVVAFGRGFGAGWRSHAHRIAIGLSTAGLAQLAVELILIVMSSHFVPKSREEYEHVLKIAEHIANANGVVAVAVLIWWIVCLWIDEPDVAKPAAAVPVKEYLMADTLAQSENDAASEPKHEEEPGTDQDASAES